MMRLVGEALYYLFRSEWLMWRDGLPALQNALKRTSSSKVGTPHLSPEQLCKAVDIACALYFKGVLCLQRSTATVMLFRHYALHAELVIGAKIIPFKSHAWVELRGQVVNDKPYIAELYRELERC
jgi:prolyl oligopeptidase